MIDGEVFGVNTWAGRLGKKKVHVCAIDADANERAEQDDREAIDKGNIMKERTRKAKPAGTYTEPSDEQMGLTQ